MLLKSERKSHYLGHRTRMRKKFLFNSSSLLDYEILEILLFSIFPRKDTKEIAKTLLQKFGSIKGIVFACSKDLQTIKGIGEAAATLLCVLKEIFKRIHLEEVAKSTIIASSDHVINYYKNIFSNAKQEQLRIMFINNKNKLITEELLQVGTITQTAIYPREIIQKALDYGASAMIMVHNHPSGDPQPSRQDIIMTKSIIDIANKLDIVLLDHLIIGKNENKSLKELGVI